MFGVLVSGRLVNTEFERVSETQFRCTIPDADSVNHIVVFMTGQSPFPDGMGGAVYFAWPSQEGVTNWSLLGHLANDKPSAIFKVTGLKTGGGGDNPFMQQNSSHMAQVGVSVEPLQQLAGQTPAISAHSLNTDAMVQFTQKMCENVFNYLSSFAITQAQMTPNPTENFVPLSSLHQWFQNFQRRLSQDPNFWRS